MKFTRFPAMDQLAPAVTLLVLSPLIVEVLFGATHVTTLFLLIPQICIYGGAALIIQTLVKRHHRSYAAVLILGIAFAIVEESVILQTSVSPLLFGGDPNHIYSWAFGVNWMYLLWAVVYESVWAIMIPIQLTELIFPARRDQPWVGNQGLVITTIAFLVASVAIWYRFTQIGIFPGKAYEAPLPIIIIALVIAAGLVAAAFAPWTSLSMVKTNNPRLPRPWLVGLAAFGLALPWFSLPILTYLAPASLPAGIPIVAGLAWAVGALLLIGRWANSRDWQDAYRLALITGALVASMLAGYLDSGISLPIDVIGKLGFNGIAMLMLIYLAWRVRLRSKFSNA